MSTGAIGGSGTPTPNRSDGNKAEEPVRAALAAGEYRRALKLASSYRHLGEQKERITRGAAAMRDPEFYKQINRDPDVLIRDGIQAVLERFGVI
jgi:hypothetical protein